MDTRITTSVAVVILLFATSGIVDVSATHATPYLKKITTTNDKNTNNAFTDDLSKLNEKQLIERFHEDNANIAKLIDDMNRIADDGKKRGPGVMSLLVSDFTFPQFSIDLHSTNHNSTDNAYTILQEKNITAQNPVLIQSQSSGNQTNLNHISNTTEANPYANMDTTVNKDKTELNAKLDKGLEFQKGTITKTYGNTVDHMQHLKDMVDKMMHAKFKINKLAQRD